MTTETSGAEIPGSTDSEATVEPGTALMAEAIAPLPALDGSIPVQFEMLDRLSQLEAALLTRDPMMKMHLAAIHKNLIANEELVHLLSDQQVGQIVAAQQVHTNTVLVSEATSKAGKAKAANRTAKLSLDDL